ncbi:hypothetical protein SUGI_0131310 [Cryptomeria japonica]|nr:hypothetical protein SUGI_0131310 [Cryptomeria japonica]
MEMQIGVWRNIPDEIALNIIARLLPRRRLVRLRSVWKAWNEMLSSYTAMQRIYPNIHLSYTSAFLFQFKIGSSKICSWVMEGNGDFYKVGEYSHHIVNACNTMFCLSDDALNYYLCDEKSRYLRRIFARSSFFSIGMAFDSSTDQFIIVAGDEKSKRVCVYNLSSDSLHVRLQEPGEIWVVGWGIYHRGRFYWLDHLSCNGGVLEFNLSDSGWTKIPPPHDAIYRDEYFRDGDLNPYGKFWSLAGSGIGPLVLVDREYGFVWELEKGGGNINSERSWRRVDMRLPKEIRLVSVNNLGWTVVVFSEGIYVYDGSRRLVRKFAIDDIDPQLWTQVKYLDDIDLQFWTQDKYIDDYSFACRYSEPPLLPLDCTYFWWPCPRNF